MKKQKKGAGRKPAAKKTRKKRSPLMAAPAPAPPAISPATEFPTDTPVDTLADTLGQAASALDSGRPQDAFVLCGEVLATQPDNAEALNLAGVAAFQIGDAAEARSLLETAIAFRPGFADALNNLGNVLKAGGDLEGAEVRYREAAAAQPGNLDAEYNLGIALEAQGRFAEAEASYRRCLSFEPKSQSQAAAANFNFGNVLKALGRLADARGAYRRSLDIHPGQAEALNNLGAVEMELGRLTDAIHCFRDAIGENPDFADAHYNLGIALQDTDEMEAALKSYRKALDCDPGHAGAQINIGYALNEMGRLDDAVMAYKRAIDMAPGYDKVRANLGDVYLKQGKAEAALGLCDDYLKDNPGNISMLAFKAIVLEELGRRDDVRELYDFDRLLMPVNPSAPQDFADMEAFNKAVSDHILDHPSLVNAPKSHATRFGRHSGELLAEPMGPMAAFEEMVMQAVEDFRQEIPLDPDHPYLARRPERLGLSVWGVAMDSQGHQLAHIHPSAWLSGVYYVQIPAVIGADDPSHAGWIEFGRAPDDFHATVEPEVRLIMPEEGLMVLFPSYFYHRTVPFESEDVRISIAFDVLAID